MSLLDDVSIVVTPNGYKAGTLHGVIPSDASADMDVTRATAGTRVDENGLVNYAEVIGSEEVFNGDFATNISGWTINTSRGSYAWDNGRAKIKNDADDGYPNMSQNISTEIGKTYKVTATVEIGTSTLAEVRIYDGAILGNQQLTSDGEIEFLFTAVGTTPTLLLYLFEAGNTGHYCYFDNVSVKQEDRNNVPRIDYTGGGCPHILAEPQRTNVITYSEDFSQSAWQKSNITATPNSIISPDGTLNAYKLTKPTSSAPRLFELSVYPSTGVHTFTSFYKNLDGDSVLIRLDAGGNTANCTVDLTTNTLVNSGANIISSNITQLSDGWIRVSVTANILSTSWVLDAANLFDLSVGSSIYIWGAQLEAGSYLTSYIPTSGSSVTRNQDIFTRDGIGSLINDSEGVLFVEMAALSDDLTYRILSLSDGTPNERVYIQYTNASNTISAVVKTGGSTQFNRTYVLSDETAFSKIAIKWKLNDFALWVDGVERATDTSGNSPSGLNRLAFDNADVTNFVGKVKQLQVYKTALTDAQLTALTS